MSCSRAVAQVIRPTHSLFFAGNVGAAQSTRCAARLELIHSSRERSATASATAQHLHARLSHKEGDMYAASAQRSLRTVHTFGHPSSGGPLVNPFDAGADMAAPFAHAAGMHAWQVAARMEAVAPRSENIYGEDFGSDFLVIP